MRLLVLFILTVILAIEASAETQYWVAVGSYQERSFAEAAQNEAEALLPQSFSIMEAMTGQGFFYRVLAGPYLTQDIADNWLREAVRRGFDGAWLLAKESAGFSDYPTTDLSASDLSAFDEELPTLRFEGNTRAPIEPEIIEEPPADYFLHKLYRD